MPKIAIILGSESDLSKLKDCFLFLQEAGVNYQIELLSAHRLPEEVARFCKGAKKNGFEAIIAAAGLAAHLPGVCASHTHLPVIGLPLTSGVSDGMDALLSIVQMPPGVPVATVGINNSRNAAVLACRILAIKNSRLQKRLAEISEKTAKNLLKKNTELKRVGWEKRLDFLNEKK
ncbi:MAG: 5-(carboxyamino)imidazole ribonucleotide mutase [Elusimicrobiota bacterium]